MFEWVYENIKQDMMLASITGGDLPFLILCYMNQVLNKLVINLGTDICSLFGSHNIALPVYAGEIQCIALGMSIQSWSEDGLRMPIGQPGDLVCTKPFVCMPVYFWGDQSGERYRSSYFEKFEGVWAHGDYCKSPFLAGPSLCLHGKGRAHVFVFFCDVGLVTESQGGNGGGLLMLGRSDGVLNRTSPSLLPHLRARAAY